MRNLAKMTHAASTKAAWADWYTLAKKAPGHLVNKHAPPEGANHKRVDKAIAALRKAIAEENTNDH